MAEHDIEKIVEAGGEVFNFRDPTKQPVSDRVTSWSSTPSDTKYPSEKLVKDSLDGKQATLTFDGTYNASTNKAATVSTVTNAIGGLDVSSVGGNGKYISAISETDGKISATETNIDDVLSATSTHPVQNKELTRWHNIVIGKDGFVSGSAAYPQLSLQKSRLGTLSLYNAGVNIKIYSFDENDEENATLEWDVSTASDSIKALYNKGEQTGTLYQSTAGKWVKILYTGTTACYFRALGVFIDTKDSSSSVSQYYGHLRIGGVDYPESAQFSTWGSLVVAAYSESPVTTVELILRPKSATCMCRIFGFRCLNTYSGSDAILIGKASSAFTTDKLSTARKLKTNLARTADSTFNGSADQTNIPVTGTLPVGNGGTGRTSVTSGSYVVGAGTSAMVEKTPKDVGSDVLSSLDNKSNASSYADFVDGDFVVGSDHVDASTINASTFVRRTALNLWNYIKSKLSGSDVNIGGNAATATKATQDSDGSAINTTYKKLAESSKFTEPQWIDNKTSQSYCDLRIGNSFKLLSVGVSGNGNISIKELADQRPNSPAQDKSIIYTSGGGTLYNFNGNAATATALVDDSGYVHITGSETITGAKEFSRAGQETNFTDSSGHDSIVRARTTTNSTLGSCQLDADRDGGKFGVYAKNVSGTEKWVANLDNDGVVNLGSSGDEVRIGGKKFVFDASQLGTESNTFYWV